MPVQVLPYTQEDASTGLWMSLPIDMESTFGHLRPSPSRLALEEVGLPLRSCHIEEPLGQRRNILLTHTWAAAVCYALPDYPSVIKPYLQLGLLEQTSFRMSIEAVWRLGGPGSVRAYLARRCRVDRVCVCAAIAALRAQP